MIKPVMCLSDFNLYSEKCKGCVLTLDSWKSPERCRKFIITRELISLLLKSGDEYKEDIKSLSNLLSNLESKLTKEEREYFLSSWKDVIWVDIRVNFYNPTKDEKANKIMKEKGCEITERSGCDVF